jgi:hypothetical protein
MCPILPGETVAETVAVHLARWRKAVPYGRLASARPVWFFAVRDSPTAAMTVREETEVAMSASTLRDMKHAEVATRHGRVTQTLNGGACAVLTNGRAGGG